MLVENYSNSRSRLSHSAVEAIFSDLRVDISSNQSAIPFDCAKTLSKWISVTESAVGEFGVWVLV